MMTPTAYRFCRLITTFALPVIAAACAPASPDEDVFKQTWGKLGRGYEAFVNDRNNCVQAASIVIESAAGREQPLPAVSASRFKSCMRSSGWEQAAGGYSAPLGYDVRIVQ